MAKKKGGKKKGGKGKKGKKEKKAAEPEPPDEEELKKQALIATVAYQREKIQMNYESLTALNESDRSKEVKLPPLWLQPGVPVLARRNGQIVPAKAIAPALQRTGEWIIRFDADGGKRSRVGCELARAEPGPLVWDYPIQQQVPEEDIEE